MKLPTLSLDKKALFDVDWAQKQEWLITNGLGSYASSSIVNINSRKYHGLLVSALNPPSDRTVCLAKLDEELFIADRVFLLGSNEFCDTFYPKGFAHLKEFTIAPYPTWLYSIRDVEMQKTVFMPYQKNQVTTLYQITNQNSFNVTCKITPMIACRHFHTVMNKWQTPFEFTQTPQSRGVELNCTKPKVRLSITATEGTFSEEPNWIEHLYYVEEALRGETSIDDNYQPGYFQISIPANSTKTFAITATTDPQTTAIDSAAEAQQALTQEIERHSSFLDTFYKAHPSVPVSDWLSWALLASDTFVVSNREQSRRSVIAGYPWFETWGRDTFISLPGLMLVTGKFEQAKQVLLTFSEKCRHGLIPNLIGDKTGEAAYNTVDATLWFVNAALQYLKYTGDFEFIQSQLWETLQEILNRHVEGTNFGIHADEDGLLMHGEQLTWMDATPNGKAATPRAGKAVEVQALWYNALKTMQMLAGRFEASTVEQTSAELANKAKASFNKQFWNPNNGALYDVVAESGKDASVRPNQVIAAALDYPIIDTAKAIGVVEIVEERLLVSCGLRTLEPDNPQFKGEYFGDRKTRDQAYHNGTVWPWLLGPFTTAYIKTHGATAENRERALKKFVEPLFVQQIKQAGMGTVSEIFDGNEPYTPRGCISQAWSIAEPLRAYIQDIEQIRPQHEKEIKN
ncbi:MAG: amylo-alpha-1,6-glucosidase [Candidatus Bathyarchaeota archaeon]|nr:amylo-alpha-1,6-glucosidase [Candidatus Bathyarchaeota archaeon]